jgi:hypothetical protein
MQVSRFTMMAALGSLLALMAVPAMAQDPISSLRAKAADAIRQRLEGGKGNVEVIIKVDGLISISTGDLQYAEIRASEFSTLGLPLFAEPDAEARFGRIGRLILRLSDFRLNGLRVEELTAVMHDSRYNFGVAMRDGAIQLLESGQGPGEVTVLFADLEPFLANKFDEIETMSVTSQNGKVKLIGVLKHRGATHQYEIVTGMGFADGTKIKLVEPQLTLDGERADPSIEQELFGRFGTVLDLDADLNLHGCLQIESIEVRGDRFRVRGVAKIPVREVAPK